MKQEPVLEITKKGMGSVPYRKIVFLLFAVVSIGQLLTRKSGTHVNVIDGWALAAALTIIVFVGQDLLLRRIVCYEEYLELHFVVWTKRILYDDIAHYGYEKDSGDLTIYTKASIFNRFALHGADFADLSKLKALLASKGVADSPDTFLKAENKKGSAKAIDGAENSAADKPGSTKPFLVIQSKGLWGGRTRRYIMLGYMVLCLAMLYVSYVSRSSFFDRMFGGVVVLLGVLLVLIGQIKGLFINSVSCYYDTLVIESKLFTTKIKYEDIKLFTYRYVGVYAFDGPNGKERRRRGSIWNDYTMPDKELRLDRNGKPFAILIRTTMFSPAQLEKLVKILRRKKVEGHVYDKP